jgi:hypothetical protein
MPDGSFHFPEGDNSCTLCRNPTLGSWHAGEVTNELLYDVLKKLQAGQAEMKATLSDVIAQLIRVREDINSVRSDDLRRERAQAQMDVRL